MSRHKASESVDGDVAHVRSRKGASRWRARLPWPGQEWPRTRWRATRVEAYQALEELREERRLWVADGETTVEEWLCQWMRARANRPNPPAPKTEEGHWTNIRKHVVPVVGTVPVTRLDRSDVERVVETASRRLSSPHSVRSVYATLSTAMAAAVTEGLVDRNVVLQVPKPSAARVERQRPLTTEEVRLLVAEAARRGMTARLLLALTTGMRQGELLALTWGDVYLDDETPHLLVRATRARVKWRHGAGCTRGSAHTEARCPLREQVPGRGATKTPSSRRTVPLAPAVVTALREQRKAVGEARLAAGGLWEGDAVDPRGGDQGVPDPREGHLTASRGVARDGNEGLGSGTRASPPVLRQAARPQHCQARSRGDGRDAARQPCRGSRRSRGGCCLTSRRWPVVT